MGRKLRVVVADDDAIQVMLLRTFLETLGHQVATAMDTGGAAQQARETAPDLLILDINMPGGGGGELVTAKVGSKVERNTPMIFVTALAPEVVKAKIPDLPHIRVLFKPVDLAHLQRTISEIVPGA